MIKDKETIPKSFDLGQEDKPNSEEKEEPESKRQKLEITESETDEKEETPKLQIENETVSENVEIDYCAPAEEKILEEAKKSTSVLVLNDDAYSSCNNS
tara:strand:+ start:421 stop:717 length:297 start_codon:yes stop_codon:yes gene_type:complete